MHIGDVIDKKRGGHSLVGTQKVHRMNFSTPEIGKKWHAKRFWASRTAENGLRGTTTTTGVREKHDTHTRSPKITRHSSHTFGIGTSHLPAFSLRFCLTVLLNTLARLTPSRSSKYAGTAPSGTASSLACLFVRSWCIAILVDAATKNVPLM